MLNPRRKLTALAAGAAALLAVPLLSAADSAAPPAPTASTDPAAFSLADAAAIQTVLQGAPAQGIAAPNVAAELAELASPDPAGRGAAEERLRRAAIAYARAERGMDIEPGELDDDFALRAPFDADAEFNAARARGEAGAWLAAQTRRDPAYLALVEARARYEDIDAHGGWGTIDAGPALKAGMRDRRAPDLRQRLAAEGYDAPAPADPRAADVFDPALAHAVADFQDHHHLKPDGVLSRQTVAALNVSAHDRLAALKANLERARWLPVTMQGDRIEADVAGPEVVLFQGGAPTLAMRAVAGETSRPTPLFASEVTAVKFNPPWIVPKDIAEREIYPKGPGYMARNDFYVAGGQLIQRAGPKASLGYVKFELDDRFQVYMHDTPARALFALPARWRSHGCIRLAEPRKLAAILLGWKPADVDAAIAKGDTRSVPLKTRIPVFVLYRTAWVAPDGKVSFRGDVYGWDAEIAAALDGHPEPKHTHNEGADV